MTYSKSQIPYIVYFLGYLIYYDLIFCINCALFICFIDFCKGEQLNYVIDTFLLFVCDPIVYLFVLLPIAILIYGLRFRKMVEKVYINYEEQEITFVYHLFFIFNKIKTVKFGDITYEIWFTHQYFLHILFLYLFPFYSYHIIFFQGDFQWLSIQNTAGWKSEELENLAKELQKIKLLTEKTKIPNNLN